MTDPLVNRENYLPAVSKAEIQIPHFKNNKFCYAKQKTQGKDFYNLCLMNTLRPTKFSLPTIYRAGNS